MTPSEKIREQILLALQKQDANAALAVEYTRLCRDLNRRLEQIEEVLDRGDDIQALQMAENYPSVMDEADSLSFFRSAEWGRLCERQQASVAPSLRFNVISKLNSVYGRGIASSHSIYRDLREAILARDDEKALSISRTIESLSPSDLGAKSERERLERKVLSNLIAKLSRALSESNESLVIRLLDEIEQMALLDEESMPTEIRTARQIREVRDARRAEETIRSLLPPLDIQSESQDWKATLEQVSVIENLSVRYGIKLDAVQNGILGNAREFAQTKKASAVKQADFSRALRSFLVCLDDATSKTQARGTLAIDDATDLLTKLNKEWQAVESFGMPLDPARVEETSRVVETLRNEINRMQKGRVGTTAAITAIALVLLVVTGWFITIQYRASDMSREISACRHSRSVASVKKLLSDAAQSNLPKFSPKLSSEIETSKKWLEAVEKECIASVETLAGLLKRSADFMSEEPVKLDSEVSSLKSRVKELPDEQQKIMQPDLFKLDKVYSDYLAGIAAKYDKKIEEALSQYDKLTEGLAGNGLTLEQIKKSLEAQQELQKQWDPIIHSQIKDLPISASLKAQAEVDEEKTKVLALSIGAAEAALKSLDNATSVDNYRSALGLLKNVKLPFCNLIPSARIAWNTDCSIDSLLPDLLFPGNPSAYVALKQGKADDNEARRLFPKTILPNEVTPFASILNDELTPDVKVYYLEGGDPPRTVYSKTEIKTLLDDGDYSIFTGKTYDPQKDSATTPEFSIKTYRAVGKGWVKAKKFSNGTDAEASKIYRDLGLKEVVSDSMEVHVSPIQILDRLTQSEAKDTIYKAFVIQQLLEMTSKRPRAWGLQYTPGAVNLMKEVDQVIRVNSGNLPQGAWMAPIYKKMASQLQPLLDKPRKFNGEAQLNKMLAEQVVDGDTFAYAGYVTEDGVPHLMPDIMPPPADLYGISGDAESRKASCVYRLTHGSEQAVYDEVSKPVLLMPLYYLKKGRENMVEAAIHALRLDRYRDELNLPPLFTVPSVNNTKQ